MSSAKKKVEVDITVAYDSRPPEVPGYKIFQYKDVINHKNTFKYQKVFEPRMNLVSVQFSKNGASTSKKSPAYAFTTPQKAIPKEPLFDDDFLEKMSATSKKPRKVQEIDNLFNGDMEGFMSPSKKNKTTGAGAVKSPDTVSHSEDDPKNKDEMFDDVLDLLFNSPVELEQHKNNFLRAKKACDELEALVEAEFQNGTDSQRITFLMKDNDCLHNVIDLNERFIKTALAALRRLKTENTQLKARDTRRK